MTLEEFLAWKGLRLSDVVVRDKRETDLNEAARSHSCLECGITTTMPGCYCTVCADELSSDGVYCGMH